MLVRMGWEKPALLVENVNWYHFSGKQFGTVSRVFKMFTSFDLLPAIYPKEICPAI